MKYLLPVFTLIIMMVSCSKNSTEMKLTGNVKGLKKGVLLLQKIEDTVLISVDSVIINGDSHFEFSEKIKSPEVYYLYVRLKDGTLIDDRIAFFAEPGEITINTNLKKFAAAAHVSGSKNEEAYKEYQLLRDRYTNKNLEYIQSNFAALQKGDDSLSLAIQEKRNRLISSNYFMTLNFALNHNDYEVAPYLMISEIPNANVKYLDTVYNALTPKIKDSKYGKVLESYIADQKKAKN